MDGEEVRMMYLYDILFELSTWFTRRTSSSYDIDQIISEHERYPLSVHTKLLLSMIEEMSKVYVEQLQINRV